MEEHNMETSPEEMEKKQKVVTMCTCEGCPSYLDCKQQGGDKELGFCLESVGKSGCIEKEKGCICPQCPVTPMMGLTSIFFCTRGSEMEQKGE